jgi:hypothetical protein
MSITKTKSNLVSVGLYLEADEVETLRAAAKKDGRSLSAYVRRLFFADGCITTPANKADKNAIQKLKRRRVA